MLNFIVKIDYDPEKDMVIVWRKSGYTKMPYKRYLMLVRTGKLK
ncbi:unknown [Bacteroides intestinalis CAG:564]|nr:unknown [Bacteroides intestinalis CAG:564]